MPQTPRDKAIAINLRTYRGISRNQWNDYQKTGKITSDGRNMRTDQGKDFKKGIIHTTDWKKQAIAHGGKDGVLLTLDRTHTQSIPRLKDIRKLKSKELTHEHIIKAERINNDE